MKIKFAVLMAVWMSVFHFSPFYVNAKDNVSANEQSGEVTAYDVALLLNDEVCDYLDEVYIEKYPEMGLRIRYGTEEDKNELKRLSDLIIEETGAETDYEKTAAVIGWVRANIDYSLRFSAIPMDVLRYRKGNCLSYSILIAQLLRAQSIKAVAVDGYRADLRTFKEGELISLFDGHAWNYVYIDGAWMMFDALWSADEPLTDKEYNASWYFPNTIEGITMVTEGEHTSFAGARHINIYENGRFMTYADGEPYGGNTNFILNNLQLCFTSIQDEFDGYWFIDAPEASENWICGEICTGGKWLTAGDGENMLNRCYENGLHAYAETVEYEGEMYYGDTGSLIKLDHNLSGYWIHGGALTLPVGFSGYVFGDPLVRHGAEEDTVRTYWLDENSPNKNVTVREDGYITVNGPGYFYVSYRDVSSKDGRLFGSGFKTLGAEDAKIPYDFTFRTWDISETCRVELEEGPYFYSGSPVKPEVYVYEPQIIDPSVPRALHEGIDYTVSYQNNNQIGTAYAVIKGKGNYTGEVKIPFTIEKEAIMPSAISFRETSVSILAGSTKQLKAVLTPEDAYAQLIWTSGDPQIAEVFSDGTVSAKRGGITVITAETANGLKAECVVTVLFKDAANSSSYYYEPVYWAAMNGITTGTSANEFSPSSDVTRGQMVSFLWRMAGSPKPSSSAQFIDVKAGKYYTDPIAWASENNITTGYGDGRFGPDDRCTREQIVTFLWRYADMPMPENIASFKDLKEGAWYVNAVSWAAENKITTGLNDGTDRFGVGMPCTRAMAVTFLYRFHSAK